jgi:hypothetical protein
MPGCGTGRAAGMPGCGTGRAAGMPGCEAGRAAGMPGCRPVGVRRLPGCAGCAGMPGPAGGGGPGGRRNCPAPRSVLAPSGTAVKSRPRAEVPTSGCPPCGLARRRCGHHRSTRGNPTCGRGPAARRLCVRVVGALCATSVLRDIGTSATTSVPGVPTPRPMYRSREALLRPAERHAARPNTSPPGGTPRPPTAQRAMPATPEGVAGIAGPRGGRKSQLARRWRAVRRFSARRSSSDRPPQTPAS